MTNRHALAHLERARVLLSEADMQRSTQHLGRAVSLLGFGANAADHMPSVVDGEKTLATDTVGEQGTPLEGKIKKVLMKKYSSNESLRGARPTRLCRDPIYVSRYHGVFVSGLYQDKAAIDPRAGDGIFTSMPIKKGVAIGEYRGKDRYLTISQYNSVTKEESSHFWLMSTDKKGNIEPIDATFDDRIPRVWVIDGHPLHCETNLMPMINAFMWGGDAQDTQRKKQNVKALEKVVSGRRTVTYYTTRRIKAGDELIVDYGEGYWAE